MNLLEFTLKELTEFFRRYYSKGEYHAKALLREVIKKGNPDIESIPEFRNSPKLLALLESNGHFQSLLPSHNVIHQVEELGTIKFITRLHDHHHIESVIIPMKQYNTLCVSTQAGCRMGCRFCQTAGSGFQRNLTLREITAQLFSARFFLKKKIKNIVFMGMGEPLDNLDAVTGSIRVLNEQHGFDIALRHITLSTCGLIPGMDRLAKLNLSGLNLAVSINSADNELRSHLMPVNRKYPLEQLKETLLAYPLAGRRLILVEYILFKGLNDTMDDARELADYLVGLKVRVNLIGFNPGPDMNKNEFREPECHIEAPPLHDLHEPADEKKSGIFENQPFEKEKGTGKRYDVHTIPLLPVEDEDIHRFASHLESFGIFAVKRWGKGRALQAGCGQLSAKRE